MPTLNNDSSAVVVNPVDQAAKQRSLRIAGVSLGATLITVMTLFAAMALAPVDASAANICTLTSTQPTTNWNDTTKWSGCGGGYPGQTGAGDTAIIALSPTLLNVNVPLNPIALQISSIFPITVASGATLTLQSSSTATSGNTFTVVSGGTIGTESGANITNFAGNVTVSGGTFNSLGTIQFSGGNFTFNGGSLTGSGTISAASAQFTGNTSAMSMSGTTFNATSFLTYSGTANALSLSSGAAINVASGATFNVQNDLAINGTSSETIHVLSGGAMHKTSGTSANVISCLVKNDGTVDASTGGTGGFKFTGDGTHSGSFITSSSQPIVFGGNHTFNSGTSFSGGSPVKFDSGTQTFNASINASSGVKWEGGTIAGNGPLNIASSLSMEGSDSAMTLTGVIKSTASITYAPLAGNLLTINGASAVFETAAPGSLAIAGDYDILASPAGAGTLRISGTANVTKTGGTAGSSIQAFVDNQSSTLANSVTGPLNIAGGGQSTGSVSVPSASNIINFTGGTFASSGVFSGSGTINVAGGTLNVNVATTFNGAPTLGISSGTLGGTGAVTLTGSTTWSGGTITGSNPLTITSPGSLSLTGANGAMALDGRALTNNNTLLYSSSTNNLTLKNSASVVNGGTFTASGTGTIATDGSATSITNNSTFIKSSSGLFIIAPTFNNAGTGISITGGVLDIDAAGTSSAPWTMSAGTEVWFPTPGASTYTWASGTSFSGGKVTVDGSGTVATSFAMTINNTNLEVNGGTFSTPSTFTVTSPGTLKWTGGTLTGAGHTVISASTTFDMTTESSSRSVSGHTIDNSGNATLSATAQPPSLDSGSTFNNISTGTLDIQSDGSMNTNGTGTNTFSNAGVVKKSAGGSGFRFDVPYNQTGGSTDANSSTSGSTIIFNAGGSMTFGILKATQASNFVDFFNGSFTVTGGAFNSGTPGAVRINGSGAILNINAPTATTNFIQNTGTLQGTGNLNVGAGTYTWNGGMMTGSGLLIVTASGTLDIAGASVTPLVLNSHTINNSGVITYHPFAGGQLNQLTLQGTASIANQSGGILDMTDASNILQSAGATTIVNSGTIRKLTSTASSIAPAVTNNAGATIKTSAGTISLTSGTSNGILDAGAAGAINFGSGSTFTIAGGTWGGSGGGFWVTGGDVTISAPFSLSGLALNSGVIDGDGTLTLTGTNAWGGGMWNGFGVTTNNGTLTMSNNQNSSLTNRTFNNNGTLNFQSGIGNMLIAGPFNNNGLFDLQGDSQITTNSLYPATFHNAVGGTLQKSLGLGNEIAPIFNNDGTVVVSSGVLNLDGGGTHNGSFSIPVAFTSGIFFGGAQTLNPASSLIGPGNISFDGGITTINSGTVNVGEIRMFGAPPTVTLNTTATVIKLWEETGTINGSGALTITGGANGGSIWSGGTISGTGVMTINSSLRMDGSVGTMTLDTRPIVNNGIILYDAATNGLTMANGAVITNASGGTTFLNSTASIGVFGSGNSISNAGDVESNVTGSLGIAPSVTNTGTINANSGQLAFNGGLSQSAGSMNLLGGSILSPSTISLAGGTLTGNGTVFAAVNNSGGTVAPGSPSAIGMIRLNAYSQGSGGSTNIKIGGTTYGTTYDVVIINANTMSLAGTLNAALFNGFTPSPGNFFDVVGNAGPGHTGDFTTYNLPTFAGGGSFKSSYVVGPPEVALRLTAVVTASDLMISQSAPPTLLHNQNGTWTLTVTNGPTPVTNVVVTDTFANGTFVSATTSVGTCTPSGSPVTCNIGSLSANQSASVTLILNANTLATISNSASVTATEFDPDTTNNNVGPAFTTVQPAADLSITNTPSGNPVNAGSPLSFTLSVSNAGPDTTSGTITIANTFPSGATAVTGSGSGWLCGAPAGSLIACQSSTPIPVGGTAQPLVISMTAPGTGPAVDSASVSSSSLSDPNTSNNTASQSVTLLGQADLAITNTAGPAANAASAAVPIVYTITVTNHGPSDAAAVVVTDPTPAGASFVSNSGACTTAFPCALGILTAGQSKTITSTFTTPPSFTGTSIANTATVTSTTSDPNTSNNSATVTTTFGPPHADLSILKAGPATAAPGSTVAYTLTIFNNGPAQATNVSVDDATPAGLSFVSNGGGCTTAFPCSLGTLASGQSATITATYMVTATSGSVTNSAVVSSASPDPNQGDNTSSITTQISTTACGQQPPTLIAPANGVTVNSPVTFSWTAVPGATSYKLFAAIGGASTQEIGNTSGTSLTLPISGGSVVWSVQALGIANCNQLTSANGTFNVCSATPVLSVVGTSSAGQSYTVQWTDSGATSYELQEAATDSFDNAVTFPVTGTSKAFTKSASTPTAFFYRVRALTACGQGPGPYSATERVVIVPIPAISSQGPSATVDINNKHVIVQTVFIPGQGSAIPFTATSDEPWLSVSPNSGILPAAGITLSVSADPADLPNGTFTATIIITFSAGSGKAGVLGVTPPVTVPISISVVTPVSPAGLSAPQANSLIIPSVGHLDGINSQWRSDVRITNTSLQKISYLLRFTPAGGDPSQIKQTQVSIASNDTMALDDIVKNWYGVGALGDAANGVLEIRPLNTAGKGEPNAEDVSVSFVTLASSRTFNQSTGGTLGQFIPAIPFANFIGKVATGDVRAGILSMQQIAQSPSYRTNLGIVEASGNPASVLVSVFDTAGKNLLDLPIDLKAGEQQQLNSFLAAKNISLADGRVEVKVTSGAGKVMAYASVVDNTTADPLLVTGIPLAQTPSRSFVLPGVADLSTGGANWRSDLRIFNSGTDPQFVAVTLYPQTGSSSTDTISRSFTINPGEVSVLDNVLASRFGVTNIGGVMHVDTLTDANLIVTGRTYNQVDGGGTYGQFIAAVTPADGVAKGGRTLNVLQVEDSTRYRTNLGIAEVSGKPATVEVSVFLPDAKVAPKVTIPLAANEYRQFRVLQQLGVGTAYNARIAIRVIDGDGKITAYGSVIDMQTQDPTYVPAQ